MSYLTLYRKYRPRIFDDVKGQDPIVTTIRNQVKQNRIGHAYLFCGTRGTGKTTTAKILAKAANCENPQNGNPCGECHMCKAIQEGTCMNVAEIDAASNSGVENIRSLIDEISYSPAEGKYKVYIIDEVHNISDKAFNALLKTLEEPPEYVIFILATTEAHMIPITILSRCQRYDFRRISVETISDRMKELIQMEGGQVTDEAINYIARVADGSMRDALSLLDRCIAYHFGQELTYEKALDVLGAVDNTIFTEFMDAVIDKDVPRCIKVIDNIIAAGREVNQFVSDMCSYLRNLMLVKVSNPTEDMLGVSRETMAALKEQSERIAINTIYRDIRIFTTLASDIKKASQKRVLLDVTIVKLCHPETETDTASLADRLNVLNQKFEKLKAEGIKQTVVQTTNAAVQAEAPKEPKRVLTKAVEEEIIAIKDHWKEISGMANGLLAVYLGKCVIRPGGGDVLIIACHDQVGFNILTTEENKSEIQNVINSYVNKEVSLDIVYAGVEENIDDLLPSWEDALGLPIQVKDKNDMIN